ncbi:MAG: hypothetical protein WC208_16345 [Gallionella sp.]|jgi:hypothetical protein
MELNVVERLNLLSILPKEGNFITLKIVHRLREALSFTELEVKALNIRPGTEAGTVQWDTVADIPKEVSIGEKATDIIVEALKELDKQKKLTDQYFGLYEKFIEGGKDGQR